MSVLLAILLAAFAGGGFLTAFRPEDVLAPVVAAAVLGALTSGAVSGWWRRSGALAWAALVVVLGASGVAAGWAELAGLLDGPDQVASLPAPVPATASTLTVPFVLVGLAACATAELARRSPSSAGPLLPSLGVLLAALVLGGDGLDLPPWPPVGWTAAALVLVGWRARGLASGGDAAGPRHARPSRLAGLTARAPLIVAMAVLATLLAVGPGWAGRQALAGQDRERYSWEDREAPDPLADEAGLDPLSRVTTLHSGPDEPLLEVETTGPVERWRWAVLDTYDGVSWTGDPLFDPVGDDLPPPPTGSSPDPDLLAGPPAEVRQTVQVTEAGQRYLGRLVPTATWPVEIGGVEAARYQHATGTLLASAGLPDRYEVTSEAAQPDSRHVADAELADDEEARAALELPDEVPEELQTLAEDLTGGVDSPYSQAVALENHFRQQFQLALTDPPSGHSLGHLVNTLDRSGTGTASPEQFAAAYAVLARLSGLPTRVVVGFHGLGAAGEHTVTAHAATAWVEIKFEDLGWVAFDPVPPLAVEVSADPEQVASADEAPAEEDEPLDDEDVDDADDEDRDGGPGAAGDDGGGFPWAPAASAVGVVLLAVALAPAALRARRRRRQRERADPADRIAGAWAATLDVLGTAGLPITDDLGALDVVSVGHRELPAGAEPLGALGRLVNQALFGSIRPGDDLATRAWRLSDDVAAAYRRHRSARRALRDYFTL